MHVHCLTRMFVVMPVQRGVWAHQLHAGAEGAIAVHRHSMLLVSRGRPRVRHQFLGRHLPQVNKAVCKRALVQAFVSRYRAARMLPILPSSLCCSVLKTIFLCETLVKTISDNCLKFTNDCTEPIQFFVQVSLCTPMLFLEFSNCK